MRHEKSHEKITVARIKKFGQNFEISVDSDKAIEYRNGAVSELREVMQADEIYTDAKKGLRATSETLAKAFQTTDFARIADIILKSGEIQLSAQHRAAEREQQRNRLITLIHVQAVDPKNGLPHPRTRIEAALEEGKIHLDDNKSVEEQFDSVISKLRPIIPIKIEIKHVTVIIPPAYTGKAYGTIKGSAKILAEEWKSDGSWAIQVELPAGLYPEFLEKVNGVTHGEARVED